MVKLGSLNSRMKAFLRRMNLDHAPELFSDVLDHLAGFLSPFYPLDHGVNPVDLKWIAISRSTAEGFAICVIHFGRCIDDPARTGLCKHRLHNCIVGL